MLSADASSPTLVPDGHAAAAEAEELLSFSLSAVEQLAARPIAEHVEVYESAYATLARVFGQGQ